MNAAERRRIEDLEAWVKKGKERDDWLNRQQDIQELKWKLTDESWWNFLDPEQEREALLVLKEANKLVFARLGLHLQLVTYASDERR